MWFPSNYVEEVEGPLCPVESTNNILGQDENVSISFQFIALFEIEN